MSLFGLSATNADGKTTISTGFPLMKFAGKCSVYSDESWSSTFLGVLFRRVTFLTPVIPGSFAPTVFFYLHDNGNNVMPTKIVPAGGGRWYVVYQTNNTLPPPEAYCFFSEPAGAGAERYGMRLWDGGQGLIFDSGWARNTFLSVKDIKPLVATRHNAFSVAGVAKPAFPFRFNHNFIQYLGYAQEAYWFIYYFLGLARSGLTYTVSQGSLEYVAAASTAWTNSGVFDDLTHYLPIIDGADYD